jgi:hypothetical protein
VSRLINSAEVQAVVRPAKAKHHKRPWTQKKNPLVNRGVLFRLNPYAKTLRRQELRASTFLFSLCVAGLFLMVSFYDDSQAGTYQGEEGGWEEDYFQEECKEGARCWRGLLEDFVRALSRIFRPVYAIYYAKNVMHNSSIPIEHAWYMQPSYIARSVIHNAIIFPDFELESPLQTSHFSNRPPSAGRIGRN